MDIDDTIAARAFPEVRARVLDDEDTLEKPVPDDIGTLVIGAMAHSRAVTSESTEADPMIRIERKLEALARAVTALEQRMASIDAMLARLLAR